VTSGLVYGFKTLYPQLYGSMTVDANGVPLDSFVSQVRSRIQNDSLLGILVLAPVVLSMLLLQRPKIRKMKSGKLALIAVWVVSVLVFMYFLLRRIPLSVFSTANFWTAFLVYTGVMGILLYFGPGTHLERPSHTSSKWSIAAILAVISTAAVIIGLLFQAGYTMFEKDFYSIAFIDGLFPGTIFGTSLGIALKTLARKTTQKTETSQGQTWSASPVTPA